MWSLRIRIRFQAYSISFLYKWMKKKKKDHFHTLSNCRNGRPIPTLDGKNIHWHKRKATQSEHFVLIDGEHCPLRLKEVIIDIDLIAYQLLQPLRCTTVRTALPPLPEKLSLNFVAEFDRQKSAMSSKECKQWTQREAFWVGLDEEKSAIGEYHWQNLRKAFHHLIKHICSLELSVWTHTATAKRHHGVSHMRDTSALVRCAFDK